MDYGSWWANAPVPQSHPAAYEAAAHHHLNPPLDHQSSSYFSSYYRIPNPNPRSDLKFENPPVPDALHGGFEGLQSAAAPFSYPVFAPSSYYAAGGGDPYGLTVASRQNVADYQPTPYYGAGGGGGDAYGFSVKEAIRQYGMDPQRNGAQAKFSNGPEPTVQPHRNPAYRTNNVKHRAPKQTPRKPARSTTKVVQSAYCEVCKVNCDTQEVLKIHKQGKKHERNLLKLQDAITAKPSKAPATTEDKGKAVGEERMKREAAPATEEELEMKKRRVLEGGAASGEVRVCTICNVVVNSQKVFDFHIAGQRHAAVVEQQQAAVAPVGLADGGPSSNTLNE